jgi:O-acetyl-ADP-ribose deacetylase (regulator of RNase III)
VAAAIARQGGPAIQAESNAWVRQHGPVTHAHPAYTSGGNMPCKYVIHAVGRCGVRATKAANWWKPSPAAWRWPTS